MWVDSHIDQGSTFYFTITTPVNPIALESPIINTLPSLSAIAPTRSLLTERSPERENLSMSQSLSQMIAENIKNQSNQQPTNQPAIKTVTGLPKEPFAFDPMMSKKHPLRILLAEDNVVNQKVATHILQRMGYRADIAANGLEVLIALAQQSYDLIFMDMQMPEMDGLEATRQIQKKIQNGSLKVRPKIVAMTANAMQGDREVCLDAGMDDYLSKPIRNAELVKVLSECPSVTNNKSAIFSAINIESLQEAANEIGGDDPIFFTELIDSYLDNTQSILQELYTSYAQKNFEVMRRSIHTLKSSSSVVGAESLASVCREMEENLRNHKLDGLESKVAQITDEYSHVKYELERQKYH
jgi:CheY-like chemotaxis protein